MGIVSILAYTIVVGASGFGIYIVYTEFQRQTRRNYILTLRLLRAAKDGDDDDLECLLQNNKVDINGRHSLGWTALHVAAMNGHSSTVKLLIEAGADPNLPDEFTTVYLMARKLNMHSSEGVRNVLAKRRREFSDKLVTGSNFKGCTALHYAVFSNNFETVKVLWENGAVPVANYLPKQFAKDSKIKVLLDPLEFHNFIISTLVYSESPACLGADSR